ncbi:PIN domain-containing protein [Streptomyces sp. NPDC050423]|uniref:PIN domain-containing protein n=1 Tax=Streptomyces sp. NPDC050423 TaxID=3155402 RepID=UPI0034171550
MIYVDASPLLVTWMTRRSHRDAPDTFLQGQTTEPLATSTLGFVETVRTLDLMGQFPKAMEDLDARITEILLSREVRNAAALLFGRLRTLDAIHVASALLLRDDLTAPGDLRPQDARDRSCRGAVGSRPRYGGLTGGQTVGTPQ